MVIAAPDVQMPVRLRFMPVAMRVAVDATGDEPPQRDRAHEDQQRAAEHLAAALDDGGDGPADEHEEPGAAAEQQRVADGEPHRDTQRPRARAAGAVVAVASTESAAIAIR